MVTGAAAVMAAAMAMLFAVPPPVAPLGWFALSLGLLFSAHSFLTIAFYAQGTERAGTLPGGHVRLAAWRESGALTGVCAAAVLPAILAPAGAPFAAFAGLFALATLLALAAMRGQWGPGGAVPPSGGLRAILADRPARGLLLVALVNAAPVAVTSTLFLYYVDRRLEAPGWAGPLLLVFFLSAAMAAPLWARLAGRIGPRRAVMSGMALAIASFAGAWPLGPGDAGLFALVCVASGAAVGADLTLLPALFAGRLARIGRGPADGFGLWNFVGKATLALSVATVLPLLAATGLDRPGPVPPQASALLAALYAGLPLLLKGLALVLIARPGLEIR